MAFSCRKVSIRSSAAQWSVDVLVATPGGDLLPCSFAVLPTGGTFLVASSASGEKLLAEAASALGPPASAPQVVKGGSCGGEEEDGEFPFAGAMLSVTWEFPKESRADFIHKVRAFLGPCEGLA